MQKDDELNLFDVWRVIAKRWYIIFFVTLVTSVCAIYIAITTPSVYTAEALLFSNNQENQGGISAMASQLGGLASLAGINLGTGSSSLEKSIAIIKSRKFTKEFIEDEKLLPILLGWKWDKVKKEWIKPKKKTGNIISNFIGKLKENFLPKDPIANDAQNRKSEKDINQAVKIWQKIFEIKKEKTGMVVLSIEWREPNQIATWVNLIVERVNIRMKSRAIQESKKNISYLNKQLEATSLVDIRQLFYNIIEEQTKNIMIAEVKDDFLFQVIDPAVPPETRSKPKRSMIVMLGLIVGLFVGIILVFFFEFWTNIKSSGNEKE